MKLPPAIVDTNVVVAGLLTPNPLSPPAQILEGMLTGGFRFLLSVDLLAEYRGVLARSSVQRVHGLGPDQLEILAIELAREGILVEPAPSPPRGPDPGDLHLMALLAARPEAVLVTGDRALQELSPATFSVLSPASFLELWHRG